MPKYTDEQIREQITDMMQNGMSMEEIKNSLLSLVPDKKVEPPPDYDALERLDLRGAHGYQQVNAIQQKYDKLRNPPAPPAVRVDREIEAAKANGTLEDLYQQRLSKVRHGDVEAIFRVKMQFRREGLEVN